MPNNKKVLIITYYWPPASGPGVQRWLKFAKFLPDLDWEPIVITPKNGSYPNTDDTLLNDVPSNLRVITTPTLEPFAWYNRLTGQGTQGNASPVGMMGLKQTRNPIKRLAKYIRANWFIPDARKGWVPYAVKAAKALMSKENIAAIITTGPPHSTHLAGLQLKKAIGCKWMADFRDPWVDIYYNAFLPRTSATEKRDKALQDEVLKQADLVLTVGDGLATKLGQTARQTAAIYNGYDRADFQMEVSRTERKQFSLHYIGNLKANQNPQALWDVIADLRMHNAAFKEAFQLNFTGNIDPTIAQAIDKTGIGECMVTRPFAPHQEAVRQMQQAHLLLFIIPQTQGNDVILTGKLFEYLASRTQLLAIGPKAGNAAQLLSKCNRLPMLDYTDKSGIAQQLTDAFVAFQSGQLYKHKGMEHEQFSREGLTRELANWLNSIT